MAFFTRKLQQYTIGNSRDLSDDCSIKPSLFSFLYWKRITRNNNRKCRNDAFCSAINRSKVFSAPQSELDDLATSDEYHQPVDKYDYHLPADRYLSVSDIFALSNMETPAKPTHLPGHLPFRTYRAAIRDILKKWLGSSETDKIMSVIFESSQRLNGHSSSVSIKRLPSCYSLANSFDLIGLVTDAFLGLMDKRTSPALGKYKLTRFHSRIAPQMSVYEYIARFLQLGQISTPALLTALIYIQKLLSLQPAFCLSDLTVHRLLLSCFVVRTKVHNDFLCPKRLYARAGGVHPRELTILELELLRQLAWNVIPREENIKDCYLSLIDHKGGYVLLEPKYTS